MMSVNWLPFACIAATYYLNSLNVPDSTANKGPLIGASSGYPRIARSASELPILL